MDYQIKQFQQQKTAAFDVIFHYYSDSISGVIYRIVQDEEITRELVQDVFLKAWNKAETYNSKKGRFYTWLVRIAQNAAIDMIRSKAYRNSKKNIQADTFVDIIQSKQDLNQQTDTIGLMNFISKLAEKCKKIIDLLYFKGFTQKEIAEELDIPLGTVKTRSRRCLAELRNKIKE